MNNDPMMSATYQNMPTSMDFPSDFLEQTTNSAPFQPKNNTFFSPTTGYSSTNSSLSSSRNRICDDSGISSSVTLVNDTDNSSMHFLTSTLTTTVNDVIDNSAPMDFVNNDLIEDFEPMMRGRSCTWPMKVQNHDLQSNDPPLMHQRIPEEGSLYSRNGSQVSVHLAQQDPFMNNQMNNGYQQQTQQLTHSDSHEQELNYDSPPTNYSDGNSNSADEDEFQGGAVQKRSQTRRNAWGNMSYADLITQAILSSPDQRLTLSQVYEWMVDNVPYFSDKGDSNSSAGWKNSIRHNLSLHSRFMRVQNEGAGKSSWWILNPEQKMQQNKSRRRATMDSSTKNAIEKKRRGARKRLEMQNSMNSLVNRKASEPAAFYHNRTAKDEPENDSDYDSFRSRTLSNISAPGNSRGSQNQISPTFNPNNDDFNYSSWAPNATVQPTPCNNTMNDIMSRTDQICLDADSEYSQMAPLNNSQQQQMGVYSTMPQQISPNYQVKQEEIKPQFQNNCYQELNTVRGVDQQMQNPLLRNQYSQQNQFQQQAAPQFTANNQAPQQTRSQNYQFGCNRVQQRWQVNNNQTPQQFQQPGQQQGFNQAPQQLVSSPPITQQTTMTQQYVQVNTSLPKDLENLNTFVPPDCELAEIDAIIRQELSTNNLQFDF